MLHDAEPFNFHVLWVQCRHEILPSMSASRPVFRRVSKVSRAWEKLSDSFKPRCTNQHLADFRFLPTVRRCWTFWMYSGEYGSLQSPANSTVTLPIFVPTSSARVVSPLT